MVRQGPSTNIDAKPVVVLMICRKVAAIPNGLVGDIPKKYLTILSLFSAALYHFELEKSGHQMQPAAPDLARHVCRSQSFAADKNCGQWNAAGYRIAGR